MCEDRTLRNVKENLYFLASAVGISLMWGAIAMAVGEVLFLMWNAVIQG